MDRTRLRSLVMGASALLAAQLSCLAQVTDIMEGIDPPPVVSAAEVEKLKSLEARHVVVEGVVDNIGIAPKSGIRFFNFSRNFKEGFVAVILAESLASFDLDSLRPAYEGRKVRIEGTVEIYNEQPQIKLRSPDQIKVVPEEGAEAGASTQ